MFDKNDKMEKSFIQLGALPTRWHKWDDGSLMDSFESFDYSKCTMEDLNKMMKLLGDRILSDTEISHVVADDILCAALEIIGTDSALSIVVTFKNLNKWYS